MSARQAFVWDEALGEWVEIAGAPGQPGPTGPATPGHPTFIQDTDPGLATPYAWWDTSGATLTLWIEDGI